MRADYAAKTLDTCVFVAGREAASCLTEKLGARMVRFDRLAALFSD